MFDETSIIPNKKTVELPIYLSWFIYTESFSGLGSALLLGHYYPSFAPDQKIAIHLNILTGQAQDTQYCRETDEIPPPTLCFGVRW